MNVLNLNGVDYINESEAAEMLHLSKHAMRAWRRKGDVGPPWVKWHSRVLYKVSSVNEYIEQHLSKSESGGYNQGESDGCNNKEGENK